MKPNLELSKFNGETKLSSVWINKVEEFFSIHNITSDEETIKYTSMQLEDHANNWYMWWKVTTRTTKLNWNTFKSNFFKRFEDLKENYFFAKLTRLQQKCDVDEYTDEWESLATRVPKFTDSQRLQTYVYGLKPYIRDELELLNVSTLDKARHKGKIIEEKIKNKRGT